jgi:DNA-directed RNA polymerase subunit N (RpoN/RPB10)
MRHAKCKKCGKPVPKRYTEAHKKFHEKKEGKTK